MDKKNVVSEEVMDNVMPTEVKKPTTVKVVEPTVMEFAELLECVDRPDFEAVIKPRVSAQDNPDILSLEDVALLKKGHANAVLTFKENMSRYVAFAVDFADTQAAHVADPNDPACAQAYVQLTNKLQKYTNKMCAYASQIASYVERLTQIAPEELLPKRKAKAAATAGTEEADEAE